jgi:hypothetical protein
MTGRILLLSSLLLPAGAYAAAPKKAPGKALRSGNFVYLKMPRALVNKVRSPGWADGAPEWIARAGELKISPMRSLIRSPYNILTAVDAEGQTKEVEASEDEVRLLRSLGARSAGTGGFALKRFLRLEMEDPPKSLRIEADGKTFAFDVEKASD